MKYEYESFSLSKAVSEYVFKHYGINWEINSVNLSENKIYISKEKKEVKK